MKYEFSVTVTAGEDCPHFEAEQFQLELTYHAIGTAIEVAGGGIPDVNVERTLEDWEREGTDEKPKASP